ncbi:MAG: hypothetical protein MI802_05935 [Desulfobacterales bacterium]|nr:hypothetical protein [Desulfobacterales bacterium]
METQFQITEQIIEQYRQSDFNDRLNMYMAYPELRDIFARIDSEDSAIGELPVPGIRTPGLMSQLLARLAALF